MQLPWYYLFLLQSERDTHSPQIFSFICFFSHIFDNLRHQRHLPSGFAKYEFVKEDAQGCLTSPLPKDWVIKTWRIPGPEQICLVFGVVIFDELWAVKDIDIPVNTFMVLFLMEQKSTRPHLFWIHACWYSW